ncbi:MAG: EamA family transporter [Candidatus Levyibacteriota bacterium]
MTWQLLLGFSILAVSFSTILQRVLLKENKSDPISCALFFQVMTGIILGIFAFVHGYHAVPIFSVLPNIVLMTVLYALGNICIFISLKSTEASTFTITFATRGLWTVIGAVLFLGEHFFLHQIFGTLLIFLSIILVSFKKESFVFTKGIVLSLFAGFLFGMAFTNDALMLQKFDLLSYLTINFLFPGIFIGIVYPKKIVLLRSLLTKSLFLKLTFLSFLYAVSVVCLDGAYTVGRNAAQIGILFQISTIVTVIFAIFFLKETTQIAKKLLAAIFAFLGVILVK